MADSSLKCNFYKVSKRQAAITSELLEGILATLAERKSRHILAGRLPAKHTEGVTERINNQLPPHQHKYHTVIFDNDKEFAGYETIASEQLEAALYLALSYHSWERGLNENSNGILRQYFPRNMN